MRTLLYIIMIVTLLLPWCQADAQDGEPAWPGPGVVVSFEGGNVGAYIAQVLDRLIGGAYRLPTEPYTVKAGETICGILDSRGYPPPCTQMLKLVQRLNPTVRLEVLRPDDKVSLPTLSIRSYTASGAFAGDDPAQVGKKE